MESTSIDIFCVLIVYVNKEARCLNGAWENWLFENKKRISVTGEVTKVSLIFTHFLLMARLGEIENK